MLLPFVSDYFAGVVCSAGYAADLDRSSEAGRTTAWAEPLGLWAAQLRVFQVCRA